MSIGGFAGEVRTVLRLKHLSYGSQQTWVSTIRFISF